MTGDPLGTPLTSEKFSLVTFSVALPSLHAEIVRNFPQAQHTHVLRSPLFQRSFRHINLCVCWQLFCHSPKQQQCGVGDNTRPPCKAWKREEKEEGSVAPLSHLLAVAEG